MRKIRWLLVCIGLTFLRADDPAETETLSITETRQLLRKAREKYASEDRSDRADAAALFRELLEKAPEGEVNRDALRLAEAMSFLQDDKASDALAVLEEITEFGEPNLRSRHRLKKGNAHLKLTEAHMEAEKWKEASEAVTRAIEAYTNALRESPDMEAARYNLEIALKRQQEIKEKTPPQEQDSQQENQDQDEEQNTQNDTQEEQNQQEENQQEEQNQESRQEEGESPEEDSEKEGGSQESREDPQESEDSSEQDASQQEPSSEEKGEPEEGEQSSGEPQMPPSAEGGGDPGELQEMDLEAQQLRQLLEAALEQEKRQRRLILQNRIRRVPVQKDW